MKQIIFSKDAPPAIGPYSQAVRVGDLLYSAGQTPLTSEGALVEGGIKEQTKQVMENLQAVLSAAGATFDNVVKTTCFLASMDEFAAFNEVYGSYFGDKPPARTTVEAARLPLDARVEIELVAYLG